MSESRSKLVVAAAAVLLMATTVTGLYLGTQTRREFLEISRSWEGFSEDADRKGVLISRIRGHLGYGGIIHNFKNFVLRKDAVYLEAVRAQLREFDAAVAEYLSLPVSEAESAALRALSDTVDEYRRNLGSAEVAARDDWPAERIDRLVRVDDAPALAAIDELDSTWRTRRSIDVGRLVEAVRRGEGLIGVGYLSMALLVIASLALAAAFWSLLRQMRATLSRLSEQLLIHETLSRSEERLAQAVEQSPATIMITDKKGRIEYVNRHFELLSGWSREEVIGNTPRFLQSGDTDAEEYARMRDTLNEGKIWRGVLRNLRKDGGSYWVESTILPLRGPDGSSDSLLGIGEDMTERREAREQMARAQKIEAVGLLAGGIAHDFNSILTAILGSAHLASLDAENGGEQAAEIEQIEIAARRAQVLVRQLLDFARRKPGNPVPTELRAAVRQTLRLMRAATPASIGFDFDDEGEQAWVSADPTQLNQILMNLCGNAAEAIGGESGRITVLVTCMPEPPPGKPASDGPWVRLDVIDDGPGMSDHVRARIFDAFFTTKPLGKGTGLGLAVVHGIVVDMGGGIEVASEPGVGSTFTLTLPGAKPPADASEPGGGRVPNGSERLLLIDDEQELTATLRRNFTRLGYQVEGFTSSLSGLKAFERGADRFDAVISDVIMPDLDGIELAARMRAIRPDIPILFLTGYAPREISLDGPEPAIVEKPVDPLTLAWALRALLDRT